MAKQEGMKRRLCKKRTDKNMSMEFSCLRSVFLLSLSLFRDGRKIIFKDKRLLNMKNTRAWLEQVSFTLDVSFSCLFLSNRSFIDFFPRLSSRSANEERKKISMRVESRMFIRSKVKMYVLTPRRLVNLWLTIKLSGKVFRFGKIS